MEPIAVIIPTYNRAEIVGQTIRLLRDNIIYEHGLVFYVGCDGDDNTPEVVQSIDGAQVICLSESAGSFGANINRLLVYAAHLGHDLFLQLDDDHHLKHPLILDNHARYLNDFELAGWIRLMGVGYHKYNAKLNGLYWYVDWDSPELYITSMRPHLKHRRFLETFGAYPEGLKLGQTEESYCHQCKDVALTTEGTLPSVLVPLDVTTESSWDHVGNSWQSKGL